MLNGLLQHTHQEVLNPEIMDKLKIALYKMWIMDEYYTTYRRGLNKQDLEKLNTTEWEKCFEIEANVPEPCRLVLVLEVLLKNFGFTTAQEVIVSYVANFKAQPQAEDLFEYMSLKHNISLSDILDASHNFLTSTDGVFALYITFFAVVDVHQTELMSPQSLNSYIASMPDINFPNSHEFGLYLAWILNGYSQAPYEYYWYYGSVPYNPVPEFYSLVRDIWLDSLQFFLNVNSHSQATLLMNSFWHGGLESDLFQPSAERRNRGYLCLSSNNGLHTLNDICKQISWTEPECEEYCKLMDNLTLHIKLKVKDVLNMGLDAPSPSRGAFQACQHPKKGTFGAIQCWKKVVNNKGVCYSSMGDSKYLYLKCMETKNT